MFTKSNINQRNSNNLQTSYYHLIKSSYLEKKIKFSQKQLFNSRIKLYKFVYLKNLCLIKLLFKAILINYITFKGFT